MNIVDANTATDMVIQKTIAELKKKKLTIGTQIDITLL